MPEASRRLHDDAEVLLDGGIRRGSDIAKALALGARACLTARLLMFGLAVAGQAGATTGRL